jgi:tetratricopeptide (TPR) repeat protein
MATTVPIAERAALGAVRADGEDPWAHHSLGCVYLLMRRFDDSLAEFELALSLNPNFSLARSIYVRSGPNQSRTRLVGGALASGRPPL